MAANAKFGTLLLAACLSAASAHAQLRANLPEVRASLQREGPAATVNRLVRARQSAAVLDAIGQGEAGWIAIAPLLAKGADAGFAEGLGVSLAEALPRAPGAVLNILDLSDGPVLGASRVCSAPFIEPKPGFVGAYRSKTIDAVRSVGDATLRPARDACLAALKKT